MAEIFISRRAERDLRDIWLYIAHDNEAVADRVLNGIDAKIRRLSRFPQLGALRADIRPGMRLLVHGAYLILYEYRAQAQRVEIIAVVHGMRDVQGLL